VFTVGATLANAAATIALDPALASNPSLLAAAGSATSGPGDATNLQSMVATQSTPWPMGWMCRKGWPRSFPILVQKPLMHRTPPPSTRPCWQNLQDMRNSASGVSLDDEMVGLMQSQHAYEALAKVITTTQTLLDTLMQMVT